MHQVFIVGHRFLASSPLQVRIHMPAHKEIARDIMHVQRLHLKKKCQDRKVKVGCNVEVQLESSGDSPAL